MRVLSDVVVTSRLTGFVRPLEDGDWLEESRPQFEIWRYSDGEPVKLELNVEGRLPELSLPPGRYCFRVSVAGFGPATGRLEIEADVPVRALELRLAVAA